jgi:hypothetical protein
MAPRSKALAGKDGTFVTVVGTGPMKEHIWLEFEVWRVLNPAQNVPCFLVEAEKLVCCRMK